MAALIVFTLLLGGWQTQRALVRIAQERATPAPPAHWRHGAPPVPASLLLAGQWRSESCLEVGPQWRQGRAGHSLVCPLQLEDGLLLLVNLGWLPQGSRAPALPPLPLAVHTQPWPRYLELAESPPRGRVFQNLDPLRFALWSKLPEPAGYAVVAFPAAPLQSSPRREPLPSWRHWGYALSWFAMSACGMALWLRLRKEAW
ncbi:SURF1 family cytochrome oxidase biogenesis protein [Chitinilyticum piscinae]|uniref:SURF1-like protein n=1 Tax=Chitinilyticum piscinae TaxID=2866724 RepID=A0A8J7KGL4_9NEIS|nr:SURF1 family cytochrome oxidase biogenesis protein [Chitinilyticum piscinae]MBE9610494.1 hypothetical protein [Chitinilyticum piscinae]